MLVIVALLGLVFCAEATVNAPTNVDNLVAVVQVFRHGERTPVYHYPNDPYADISYWSIETGQLTNVGKQEHYELGKFTRNRYDGFLPRKYHPDDFRAQTTDVDRTHMSCQANIAAIYPPEEDEIFEDGLNWQPIPVHSIDTNVLSGDCSCYICTAEMAYLLLKDPLFAQINSQFKDTYTYLTNYSGYNVTSLTGVAYIRDALYIEQRVNLTLPDWTSEVYPEPIEVLSGYVAKLISYTTELKRLMAGSWLYTVITYFEGMWEDSTSSQKFQMYSAHDSNIASILNTLGAFDDPIWPAFASSIYIELRNISGEAVVNVWHKNDDVFEAITVDGCVFNCTLTKFKKALKSYLLDTDTWDTECAATKTSTIDLLKAALTEDVKGEMERITEILSART